MPTTEMIARLENAIEKWGVLVAEAHTGLSGRIAHIHQLLSSAVPKAAGSSGTSELPVSPALAAQRAESAALEKMLRERDLEIQSLREELEAIRQEKADTEQRRREQAIFAPPAVQESRLVEALRDRDEAHREIVSLRAEIQMLRNANASLGEAAPLDTSTVDCCDEEGRRRRFGDLLVSLGVITEEQRDIALHEQDAFPHRRFGAILVENGFTTEQTVAQVLARQLDLPFVHLTGEVIDVTAITAISAQLARRHACIPISISPDKLTLAMANPFDVVAMDNVARATGREVQIVVATASDIGSALCRYY